MGLLYPTEVAGATEHKDEYFFWYLNASNDHCYWKKKCVNYGFILKKIHRGREDHTGTLKKTKAWAFKN